MRAHDRTVVLAKMRAAAARDDVGGWRVVSRLTGIDGVMTRTFTTQLEAFEAFERSKLRGDVHAVVEEFDAGVWVQRSRFKPSVQHRQRDLTQRRARMDQGHRAAR